MKIFCIGRNYADHAKEMNSAPPSQPLVFMKPSTALLPYGQSFYLPDFSDNVHYELEVVVKIKEQGKRISKSKVWHHIGDISLGIDFTARDLQAKCKAAGHPWEIAKSFDYSAAIGKWVSISEEHFRDIQFELKKNGERVQLGLTKDMIFGIEELVEYISERFTLQKGDLIYTGTPAGVGQLHAGDVLEGYLNQEPLLFCDIK
jgi:2-keto-4-pentenoate hydratase/2-oxohepta-3-ene-1,7-dioic acid hydratase in catechol pathway